MSLLDSLDRLKGQFGSAAAVRLAALLDQVSRTQFRDRAALVRLHETLLFLRAYPASPRVLKLADRLLFTFASRIAHPADFADPEISGIAGTTFSAIFSHEVARRLLTRRPRELSADWEDYEPPDTLGWALARNIPFFSEDWPVEAHVPFLQWLRPRGARWLADNLTAPEYEALQLPLSWNLQTSPVSRSRARWPAPVFYHDGPLLRRSEISLARELDSPPLPLERLTRARADRLLEFILDTSAVRYRELYGFTWPDRDHVLKADAGRGLEIYFFGVPAAKRLPLRAYHAGFFVKNGVPIGYVETLSLFERAEVGFNLYYTFREGETAWLYARLLRLLRQLLGVTAFAVDPYQIGLQNEEAIDSGAFWFYRKLGFRPVRPAILRLTEKEEARIAATPGYRTEPATLRKLAAGPMLYGGGPEWDRFSIRQLAMHGARLKIPPELARAKKVPTEDRYLRLLQRDASLRRAWLRAGTTPD